MKPTLVVLAAGMGSRYGGLKQVDPVGPSGEAILDYSVFDAIRGGFGKVVFIIRKDFEAEFKEKVGSKYEGMIPVDYCYQDLNDLPGDFKVPEGRTKPWGTAHAVLSARNCVNEPFAVINGDDYYGKESFKILGDWLRAHEGKTGEYCLVGFQLENTLSESGAVSRGICTSDAEGVLTTVVEHHKIARAEDGKVYGENSNTGETVEVDGLANCSMNMWGFTPDYFVKSAEIFKTFLAKSGNELKSEFYIPYAIDSMIKDGTGKTEVLTTSSRWFGVTFKEDRPGVVAKFQEFADQGIYPSPLYK
jgi:dTDP-glucose pyrophosphorylase